MKWLPQSLHPGTVAGLGTAVLGLRHSFIHPCGMAMPFVVSQVPREEQYLLYKAVNEKSKEPSPWMGSPGPQGLVSATPRCRRQ